MMSAPQFSSSVRGITSSAAPALRYGAGDAFDSRWYAAEGCEVKGHATLECTRLAEGVGAALRVRVGGEWRRYEVGRTMVFAASFEHHVRHDGAEDRYVLFAILKHPDVEEGLYG